MWSTPDVDFFLTPDFATLLRKMKIWSTQNLKKFQMKIWSTPDFATMLEKN